MDCTLVQNYIKQNDDKEENSDILVGSNSTDLIGLLL